MQRKDLINLIVVKTPGTTEESARLRGKLEQYSTAELESRVDKLNLEMIQANVAARHANEDAQRAFAIQQQNKLRQDEVQLGRVFKTAVNGKVALDNEGNRKMIRSWVDDTRDERISPAWFIAVLNENPQLADSLSWGSADILDPAKRRAAALAQEETDRQTFTRFARTNGWSEVQANFHLAQAILGSGFSEMSLAAAAHSGELQLAPASQEELTEFEQEAASARDQAALVRAEFLRNHATPDELRKAAHQEFEQRRAEFQRQESERQLLARKEKDEQFGGYVPLPEFNIESGDRIRINAAYLNRLSNIDLPKFKAMLRKYGSYQLTQRLRGLA